MLSAPTAAGVGSIRWPDGTAGGESGSKLERTIPAGAQLGTDAEAPGEQCVACDWPDHIGHTHHSAGSDGWKGLIRENALPTAIRACTW